MASFLDIDKKCETLPAITSTKYFKKKNFHPEGLFSEQIFGPIKNYTCQCGTYHGESRKGRVCSVCNVPIENSDERRRRFAKISLPIPVVNPIMYEYVTTCGSKLKPIIDVLMKKQDSRVYYDEETDDFVLTTDDAVIPNAYKSWEKTEAIYVMIEHISRELSEDGYEEWKLVHDNIDKLIIHNVIVLPPDLRPASPSMSNTDVDKINRNYMQILVKKEQIENNPLDIHRNKEMYYNFFKMIQRDVNELYSEMLGKLSSSSKNNKGLIRGNILGKRVDFSGRSVIAPDPTLSLEYCRLPYKLLLEIYKLQIANKLVERNKFKIINKAINYVDYCFDSGDDSLLSLVEEIIDGEVCILNRQPSLHRTSMLGFKILVTMSNSIKIHPLVCPPFNADFDGDQMAVYIPISQETKQEILDKVLVTKNLINASNWSLSVTPSQDIILGIYMLSINSIDSLKEIVECKGSMIPKSMKMINNCFPEDYPLVNMQLTKKQLMEILNDIVNNYHHDIAAKTLDMIKELGFKYSTLYGTTLSLSSFKVDGCKGLKDKLYQDDKSPFEILMELNSPEIHDQIKNNAKCSFMVESGARGSWDQVSQIIFSRGFISDFNGNIIPEPIKASLMDGLTPREFFNSTYGCRKGLLDIALNTGVSGYLSRKLLFTAMNLKISATEHDCGATETLECYVDNLKKAKMLIGRNYVENDIIHNINIDNYKDVIGKTIQLRSPVYCKNHELCHTCYGNLKDVLHSDYVGVIAAQALGESNTQLVLRTFHTSGVAKIKDDSTSKDDMKQEDVVGDLVTASKLMHSFDKNTTPHDLVRKLFMVYNSNKDIHHVHFECIVAQMMWAETSLGLQKWRLLQNRSVTKPVYKSVQTVPSCESWLLGLAFSNPRKHILRGLLSKGNYTGIIDSILLGKKEL